MDIIDILCIFNNDYTQHCAVLLASIFENRMLMRTF